MKEYNILLSNKETIPAVLDEDVLIYGATAIAIGLSNSYLTTPLTLGKQDTIYAYHPITNDRLNKTNKPTTTIAITLIIFLSFSIIAPP